MGTYAEGPMTSIIKLMGRLPEIAVIALLILAVAAQETIPLEINIPTQDTRISPPGYKHYRVTLPEIRIANSMYLVFDLTTLGPDISDPDIYISDVLLYHIAS